MISASMQLAITLGNDAVLFALFGSLAFLTVYLVLAKGWKTEVGRSLIVLDISLALALGPSLLHRLFGLSNDGVFFAWYYTATIFLVGCATWWRVWIAVKVQWRGRNDPGPQAINNMIGRETGVDPDTVAAVMRAYRAL